MPFGAQADSTKPSPATGGKEQRVTKQRRAVSAALDELDDFVSTQELYRILQNQGVSVSLATAYRILQSLADEGLVDVLRNGEGETWAARTAAEHGFTEVAHTVEIFGLCPDCTALKAAGKL